MIVHATKKVLDELGMKIGKGEGPQDPAVESGIPHFFSWHAHLLTLNRRKTLVLMSEGFRYITVVYGVTAKDFKKWDELVREAIRTSMLFEGIRPELVDRYLEDAGEVVVDRSKNRQTTAWLNKSCEMVEHFSGSFRLEHGCQPALSHRVSQLLMGQNGEYVTPTEELQKAFAQYNGGESTISTKAALLKITLPFRERKAWRRVIVPLNYTFAELHEVIQIVFNWTDTHLHEFTIFKEGFQLKTSGAYLYGDKILLQLLSDLDDFGFERSVPIQGENDAHLGDYLPKHFITYTYDLGDDWEHHITCEDILEDYDQTVPTCLEFKGVRPPEDVGGEGGYEDFLEIMADPSHPEFDSMKEWVGESWDAPTDLEEINDKLRRRLT